MKHNTYKLHFDHTTNKSNDHYCGCSVLNHVCERERELKTIILQSSQKHLYVSECLDRYWLESDVLVGNADVRKPVHYKPDARARNSTITVTYKSKCRYHYKSSIKEVTLRNHVDTFPQHKVADRCTRTQRLMEKNSVDLPKPSTAEISSSSTPGRIFLVGEMFGDAEGAMTRSLKVASAGFFQTLELISACNVSSSSSVVFYVREALRLPVPVLTLSLGADQSCSLTMSSILSLSPSLHSRTDEAAVRRRAPNGFAPPSPASSRRGSALRVWNNQTVHNLG